MRSAAWLARAAASVGLFGSRTDDKALCGKRPQFIRGDVREAALIDRIFADQPVQGFRLPSFLSSDL